VAQGSFRGFSGIPEHVLYSILTSRFHVGWSLSFLRSPHSGLPVSAQSQIDLLLPAASMARLPALEVFST
jgi:hypothetical protein